MGWREVRGGLCSCTACSPQLNEQKCIFVSFYRATASTYVQNKQHSGRLAVIAKAHAELRGLPAALDKSIMLSQLARPELLQRFSLIWVRRSRAVAAHTIASRLSNDCCHKSCGNLTSFYLHLQALFFFHLSCHFCMHLMSLWRALGLKKKKKQYYICSRELL